MDPDMRKSLFGLLNLAIICAMLIAVTWLLTR